MQKVLVMMSTFNGEKFLREQLDSLLNQKNVEIHLLVRDDGSKDDTCAILESYEKRFKKMIILKGGNVGASKSFYTMILYAIKNLKKYDYYAFCDQDDVWLDEKIIKAVCVLEDMDDDYKFYFCRTQCVNEHLIELDRKKVEIVNSLPANIVSNHSAGCSQVFNQNILLSIGKMAELIVNGKYKGTIPLHDCLAIVLAYLFSKQVYFDDYSYVLYRQHNRNVVGGKSNSFRNRIKRCFNPKFSNFRTNFSSNLMSVYGENISKEAFALLTNVSSYKENVFKTLRLAFSNSLYVYSFRTNVLLFFCILLRKF